VIAQAVTIDSPGWGPDQENEAVTIRYGISEGEMKLDRGLSDAEVASTTTRAHMQLAGRVPFRIQIY
jgi:TRAP-type uncharacterized transport system substrate-binding protein